MDAETENTQGAGHYTKKARFEYSVGTHVKLHTNDTWNDMHGIIHDLNPEAIEVFCVTKPLYRYFVSYNDAGRVLELVGGTQSR